MRMTNDVGLPVEAKWIREPDHRCPTCDRPMLHFYLDKKPTDEFQCLKCGVERKVVENDPIRSAL